MLTLNFRNKAGTSVLTTCIHLNNRGLQPCAKGKRRRGRKIINIGKEKIKSS